MLFFFLPARIRSGTRVSPDQDEEDYENMTEVDKRLGTVSNLGRVSILGLNVSNLGRVSI